MTHAKSSPWRRNIGYRIRKARKSLGLTVADLALKISVRSVTIKHWELGYSMPRIDNIPGLCIALGLTPNDLLMQGEV